MGWRIRTFLHEVRRPWPDARAERVLGALSGLVLLTILAMVVFVFAKAWPSFQANGLSLFGPGGNVDEQLNAIFNSSATKAEYTVHMWPLIYATLLTTGLSVAFGLVISLLTAVFIVEFAPRPVRGTLSPVVRLLAAVPSVVYGLIGILVLVPFVGKHLITDETRESVTYVITGGLNGASLLVAVAILTVMIVPIMIALTVDALESVPRSWKEGAVALGVNRWRAMWSVSVRAARPAIVAAIILATARAIGEAIMLAMVSGSVGFAPNPLDGLTFWFEPLRTLAATIVDGAEGLSVKPYGETIYAMAALLLVSCFFLSFAGWLVKRPLKKYGLNV